MIRIIFISSIILFSSSIFSQTKNEVAWPSGNFYYVETGDTIYLQFSPASLTETYSIGSGKFRSPLTQTVSVTRNGNNIFLMSHDPRRPRFESWYMKIKYVDNRLFIMRAAFKSGLTKRFIECIPY